LASALIYYLYSVNRRLFASVTPCISLRGFLFLRPGNSFHARGRNGLDFLKNALGADLKIKQ